MKEITEAIDPEETTDEVLKTNFIIHDGKEDIRIIAMKNCWGIQRLKNSTDKETKEVTSEWVTDRFVVDLGMVANRVFEIRLKNSEATTLQELSRAGKQIATDIRKQFQVYS